MGSALTWMLSRCCPQKAVKLNHSPTHPLVSSGWSGVWLHSNTGLSGAQFEQIQLYLGFGHFVYPSFLAATKQLYEWFSLSVRPSVRLSVYVPSSYHHEIFRSSERSDVHAKGSDSRSLTQLYRFRTVTPVWIHIWWWNGSLIMVRRGALLFFKVSKFQGHTALKIVEFDPDWAFPDCNSSLNSPMATKWCTKLEVA